MLDSEAVDQLRNLPKKYVDTVKEHSRLHNIIYIVNKFSFFLIFVPLYMLIQAFIDQNETPNIISSEDYRIILVFFAICLLVFAVLKIFIKYSKKWFDNAKLPLDCIELIIYGIKINDLSIVLENNTKLYLSCCNAQTLAGNMAKLFSIIVFVDIGAYKEDFIGEIDQTIDYLKAYRIETEMFKYAIQKKEIIELEIKKVNGTTI